MDTRVCGIRRTRMAVMASLACVAFGSLMPAAAAPLPPYRMGDRAVTALNILPPGQGRHLNAADFARYSVDGTQPDENTDQLRLYESLVQRAPGLGRDSEIYSLFKDASFGVAPRDVARAYSPRRDVRIVRDISYNVPHVFGTTRAGTMFGNGYVTAEDRLFMMDVLRHVSRGRLSEFLGASDANLAMDRAQRGVADYTEEELTAMGTRLEQLHPALGRLARADLEAFAAGVNAYITEATLDPTKLPAEYAALQQVPRPWQTTDSISLSTLIGGTFSVGGGGQLANDAFLDALEGMYPGPAARAIFDDFRAVNDPEATTSTLQPFPYNAATRPADPAAVARPDDAAPAEAATRASKIPAAIDGPFGRISLFGGTGASNALLVGAEHSATGRPLAVMGPQVGYFSPQILMEIDMHGPGIHARGATFPGISLYVLLGRGAGYGWSATTAIGDHIDIRAVRLCNPRRDEGSIDDVFYLRDGRCMPMHRRTDSWLAKPSASGQPDPERGAAAILVEMTTERVRLGSPGRTDRLGLGDLPIGPDWAIVVARGHVGGEPVAFVRQRASYGIEVDSALSFASVHDPARVRDVEDLQRAFDMFSFSFNWHFIDDDSVAFYTTGHYPVMAPGVDQDMPFWGDSRWDWQRYLSFEEHPQAIDPRIGFIPNWNNKQAPGFRAADNWWGYSSVGRVEMLSDKARRGLSSGDGRLGLAEIVQIMGLAATQDLRGLKVLPYVLDVIESSPVAPELADEVAMLRNWVAGGAHRRDLDGDGLYEHRAAVALMDALWANVEGPAESRVARAPLLEEIFSPALGAGFEKVPLLHDDAAGPGGSAYLEGWYGHVQKDLRAVLGIPVQGAFSRAYCGAGDVSACRDALIRALDRAIDSLPAAQADWGKDLWAKDGIEFSALGAVDQREMHWQNRPTFQQVLEFE